jgi:hypothetical protein
MGRLERVDYAPGKEKRWSDMEDQIADIGYGKVGVESRIV